MARFGDSDLAIFFTDQGVAVVFGGATAKGLLDEPEELDKMGMQASGVVGVKKILSIPFNAFTPMPEPKQAITVDGGSYTVVTKTAPGDGRIFEYGLKLA